MHSIIVRNNVLKRNYYYIDCTDFSLLTISSCVTTNKKIKQFTKF